jgi:hypothetical protein
LAPSIERREALGTCFLAKAIEVPLVDQVVYSLITATQIDDSFPLYKRKIISISSHDQEKNCITIPANEKIRVRTHA